MRKFIRLADVNLTTLTAVDVDVNVNVHPFGCCCLDDVDVTDLTTVDVSASSDAGSSVRVAAVWPTWT